MNLICISLERKSDFNNVTRDCSYIILQKYDNNDTLLFFGWILLLLAWPHFIPFTSYDISNSSFVVWGDGDNHIWQYGDMGFSVLSLRQILSLPLCLKIKTWCFLESRSCLPDTLWPRNWYFFSFWTHILWKKANTNWINGF